MTGYPPPPPQPHVRRLSCLMVCLTALLAMVLVVYALPVLRTLVFGGGGQPRAVTPRGDLMDYEKATMAIFKTASPSVAFITTEARRLDRFSRRVTEVPQGS